jgi:hypothetical protein
MQNFDHNIGFCEKRQFFRQKLSKIAENSDHNIDPALSAGGQTKLTVSVSFVDILNFGNVCIKM